MKEAPRTRLFNKQRYSLHTEFMNKRDAEASAREWKRAGYRVRVVRGVEGKGYLVYARRVAGRKRYKV